MRDSDWTIIHTLHTHRNITKVANLLFMTQPTLTKRLQQIEDELGVIIVNRSRKGVVFTAQGEYLAQRSKEILCILDEIKEHLSQMDDSNTGTIKIGVSNSYGRFILPSLLQHYKSIYKNVDFNVITAFSSEIVNLVHHKDVQIGFVRGDQPSQGEEKHLLAIDKCYIASKDKVTLEDLPKLPRIDYEMDSLNRKLVDHWWFDNFSEPPLIGMHVNHGDTCREMVSRGLGYGVFLVKDYIFNDSGLYMLPMYTMNKELIERRTWMIYRSDYYKTGVVKNFVDYIKDNFPL